MNKNKLSHKVFQDPRYFVAFGFGAGLSPHAPGTMGTLMAVPLYLVLATLPALYYALLLLLGLALGIWFAKIVTRYLGKDDYPGIVWDEIIGYFLTMFYAPPGWLWIILGFVLFRFFDIVKPWPISWVDKKIKGGLGVMLDDLLAGLFALLCLQILAYFWTFL